MGLKWGCHRPCKMNAMAQWAVVSCGVACQAGFAEIVGHGLIVRHV